MAASPTPSEENRLNTNDASMYAALDGVIHRKEQSYEDFLTTFPHLPHSCKPIQTDEEDLTPSFQRRKPAVARSKSGGSSRETTAVQQKEEKQKECAQEEAGLEEEVLGEGETRSCLRNRTGQGTGTLVQFDNFVDAENLTDNEEDEEEEEGETEYLSSYVPSTSNPMKEKQCTSSQTSVAPESDTATPPTGGTTRTTTHTENRSVEPDRVVSPEQALTVAQPVLGGTELDNLLNSFMKDILEEGGVTTPRQVSSEPQPATEPDECSEQFLEVSSSVNNSSGPGGLENSSNEGEEGSEQTTVFPGEVEEIASENSTFNLTLLDFKATFRETAQNTESEQVCSDAVEMFTLDEDFDYDNVLLTPKYSLEDVEKMGPLLQQKFQGTVQA